MAVKLMLNGSRVPHSIETCPGGFPSYELLSSRHVAHDPDTNPRKSQLCC